MSKPFIHPTAIVDPAAVFDQNAAVGAYAIVRGAVQVGAGTRIGEHCHIHAGADARTVIGSGCVIGPAAFVGMPPQHRSSDGKAGWCVIGDGCILREQSSIHRPIHGGEENATRVGARTYIMAEAHVGHDCVVGEDVILAHAARLGGHCQVGDRAVLGGASAIHQFVRIGRLAMVGGNELVAKDVPPYGATLDGRLKGYNAVGCRRSGLSAGQIRAIRSVYQQLRSCRVMNDLLNELLRAEMDLTAEVKEIVEFIRATKRGVLSFGRSVTADSRASLPASDNE